MRGIINKTKITKGIINAQVKYLSIKIFPKRGTSIVG
jgi:hypothetical protein